jgi:hypothetical protein
VTAVTMLSVLFVWPGHSPPPTLMRAVPCPLLFVPVAEMHTLLTPCSSSSPYYVLVHVRAADLDSEMLER